jgi:hypothetical protein
MCALCDGIVTRPRLASHICLPLRLLTQGVARAIAFETSRQMQAH